MLLTTVVTAAVAALLVSTTSTEATRNLEAKPVDVGWVQEQFRDTFLATIPKSDRVCGSKFLDHGLVCIYCVDGACGSHISRGQELSLHAEGDSEGCINRFRILTEPNPNGACAGFIRNQVMITG